MSACDNFVEQLWRKGKCANCFQSRESHQNDKLNTQDDSSFAGPTENNRSKQVLIHRNSQRSRNVIASNVEKTGNSTKEENEKEENTQEGVNGIKTIAPCTTDSKNDNGKGRSDSVTSDTGKTEEDSKSFVVSKPKPVPRPKPRLTSRAVEVGSGTISRDESPQKSSVALNDSTPHENSLGNSHNRPPGNANSAENSERVFSIPDHDITVSNESSNNSNIETFCEAIVDEEAIMDLQDAIDTDSTDSDDSGKILSNNAPAVDSIHHETDLSELTFVDDDDSDVDGYVPMKSNIVLFTAAPIQLNNTLMHKTDVMEANSDVTHHSPEKAISDPQTATTCDSQVDNESEKSSDVLEFRNPLCLITSEMGSVDSNSTQESGDACNKLISNTITSKSASAEPFYINRPASTSSSDTGSASHDSGYENTRKSTRSDSSNSSVTGNVAAVVSTREASVVDSPLVFNETNGGYVIESSGTTISSWGSSTWDSCSASDFQENSCEGLLVEKAAGKFDVRNKVDKPHSKVLTTQAKSGQLITADKGNVNAGHVYVNTTLKPFTKPYKVVDISTGVSVPTAEGQNDVPPLPPKEKDKKDKTDEFKNHVYLEPSEEAPSIPEQGPPEEKKDMNVAKESTCASPPPTSASNSVTDKSVAVRRAPAPRPRSRVPSQFGTLPKPAPRMSRILNDAPNVDNKEVKEQKVAAAQPVVPITPPPCTPSPAPPTFQRLPSLKNSNQAKNPTSPPLPKKDIVDPGSSDEPSERVPLSPVNSKSHPVGEAQEGPIKPKRSAPPPPPSVSNPPPLKSPVSQPVTPVKPVSPSSSQSKPSRSSTFSGAHGSNPAPPKVQPSPKSTLRRAFASMKKLGGKKKNRHSKTIEISAPIVPNEDVPGFLVQKETMLPQTTPEQKPVEAERISTVETERSEAPGVESVTSSPPSMPASPAYSTPVDAPSVEGRSSGTCSPVMQTRPGIGYQNFPLSKGGDTLERPKKPPRVAKVVKPLQHSEATPGEAPKHYDEEPTYLQPNQDELTLKVETALANLNDAEILAEALSRVEQEKLGPLPAIPRSRQVRFRCEDSDVSSKSPGEKPEPARRPVRMVPPTLINGAGDKGESKSRPKLPSRPPNTKPSAQTIRERSHSFQSRALEKHKPVVTRSRSLSSANVLEQRYHKILKLQLQTLEEMIRSWKDELLPDGGLDLSDTRWSDYEVCGVPLEVRCPGAVLLPVKCALFWEGNKKLLAKVEYPMPSASHVSGRSPYKHDLRVCEALPHHVSISRVLTHFSDEVSGDVIGRADCDSYETLVSITDQIPCETVADFVKRSKEEHENDSESYEKKVCLVMLQVLSAIDHLHKECVVHRDLKAENLFLLDCGLVVIAHFQHALQQPKSSRPSPFILRKNASSDLGGNWEHLPPEILNAPEETDMLNYEDCDTFAAGCLVYEFLHRPNPFAVNPILVQQDYDQTDLPPIPIKSRFSKGLGTIARQLLQRYPQERLSAGEALQMFQVLLWGPRELDDDSIENAVGDWLETERAHTVAMIARNQKQKSCSSDDFVETYMKCQFLVDASSDTISYIYQHLDLDK